MPCVSRLPSYKLLDVAKDHGQTILMVSQSIMIPVDICWHVDLPTSFTVSPKRARKRFGRYGQMLTVMSSKKQILPQHSAALRCSLGALLNGQVMFFVMACTWRLASYTWKWPPSLGTTQRSTFQATGQLSSFGCLLIRVWFPRPSGHGNWNWLFSDYIETRLPHTVPWLFVWYFLLLWPRACFFSLIYLVHPTSGLQQNLCVLTSWPQTSIWTSLSEVVWRRTQLGSPWPKMKTQEESSY